MREIFEVYLTNGKSFSSDAEASLTLPATSYQLMDALDKLCLREEDEVHAEITDCHEFEFLERFLKREVNVFELNLLAQKLTELDEVQRIAFAGMVEAEARETRNVNKKWHKIQVPRLIDMAYSTDCCHVASGVVDDEQLGRFCAENGLTPAVEDISDEVFRLLDFERIGCEHREAENGVFTFNGYVERHSELKEVFKTLDLIPQRPPYTILMEAPGQSPKMLPADTVPLPGRYHCLDCAVPTLIDAITNCGDIEAVNQLAQTIAAMDVDQVAKYKALVGAADCQSVDTALELADTLDSYVHSPQISSPTEAAFEHLEQMMPAAEVKLLQSHVNLYNYGRELLQKQQASLTDYGLIRRTDGQPVQAPQEPRQEGGMTFA